MQVLGVDPGTGSWDFFGLEESDGGNDNVFLDISITTKRITQKPRLFLDILNQLSTPHLVTAPSGFGLPLKQIKDLTSDDIALTLLKKGVEGQKIGLQAILNILHEQATPGYVIPGVKHLTTVPAYRKINRIDLGTADKVCTAAVGLHDQHHRLNIPYEETNFIMLEVGTGFTAILAVENGKIIDGIGGTNILGLQCCGGLDGELAYLIGNIHKKNIYGGGVSYIAGYAELSLQELLLLSKRDEQTQLALKAYTESIIKGLLATSASFSDPSNIREILVAGRATQFPELLKPLEKPLGRVAPIRKMASYSKIAKRAAQGSAFIASGLSGGKYADLVECMQLKESCGSILDYVYVPHDNPLL